MEFEPTPLAGVVIVKPRVFRDERGYFCEAWQEREFAEAGIHARFVQDNLSHSVRRTLRGMHYQIEQTQGKLVHVVQGAAFDAVIDLRRSSSSFGRWFGVELNAKNHYMLWIPPGLAHGYFTLSDRVDFLYKCTDFYAPQHERSICWNDPDVAISWPLAGGVDPLLSYKDEVAPRFRDAEYLP